MALPLMQYISDAPKWLRWSVALIIGLPMLGAGIFGFYSMGVNAGAWGRRIGDQERINIALNERHLFQEPPIKAQIELVEGGCGPDQKGCASIGVFGEDAVCTVRWMDGDVPGQAYSWLVRNPDKVLGRDTAKFGGFGAVAHAEEAAPPVVRDRTKAIKKPLAKEGGRVKIQFIYPNGCTETVWIDLASGRIVEIADPYKCPASE